MSEEKKVILVSSIVSHRDKSPRIDITVGEIRVQLSAMEARSLAANILQATAAAESDAFIFNFLRDKLNQSEDIAGVIMIDFRDYRDKLEKEWREE
ncbi:MAG TPA: hypothetical protein VFL19_04880 [Nitrospira sp.]|nr:hypothetical protein [Nitrospira sp.]